MKGSSNSVRWRPGQKEKLEAIAEKCGLEVIDIVRNAADAVIKYAEAHGGVVPFPLDFEIGYVPFPISQARQKRNVTLTETTPPNLEPGSRRLSSRPRRVQTVK